MAVEGRDPMHGEGNDQGTPFGGGVDGTQPPISADGVVPSARDADTSDSELVVVPSSPGMPFRPAAQPQDRQDNVTFPVHPTPRQDIPTSVRQQPDRDRSRSIRNATGTAVLYLGAALSLAGIVKGVVGLEQQADVQATGTSIALELEDARAEQGVLEDLATSDPQRRGELEPRVVAATNRVENDLQAEVDNATALTDKEERLGEDGLIVLAGVGAVFLGGFGIKEDKVRPWGRRR